VPDTPRTLATRTAAEPTPRRSPAPRNILPLARFVFIDGERGSCGAVPAAELIHRAFFGGRWAGGAVASSPHNG
jgi:hypothetical protein